MRAWCAIILALSIPAANSFAEAQKTLVIALHDNLVLKEHLHRAQATLKQLIELIGQRVRVKTELKIIPGGTREAMGKTVAELRSGRVHLVAATGLEYGWLRELIGRDIEALVVGNNDKNVPQYERVYVRADSGTNLEGLRGGTLAAIDMPHPSMKVYLKQLRRQWGASFLNKQTGPFPTTARALNEVLAGRADAAIVDVYTVQGYDRAFPGRMAKLKPVGWSRPYPLVPVAGIPRVVNSIRPDLWRDARAELSQIHGQSRAAAFLEVWRVSRFLVPNEKFYQDAIQSARDFPLSDLTP